MSDKLGIINKPPYFDDFDSSKNYSKILFKPGKAIQSRELTQIQSLLQNQISSLGDKVLTSPIISGGDFQLSRVKYLKFYSSEDPSFLKNKLAVFGDTTKSTIKILEVQENTDFYGNNWAIFFEYKNGKELPETIGLNPLPSLDQTLSSTIVDEENLEQTSYSFTIKLAQDYNSLSINDRNANTGLSIYGDVILARLGIGVFYRKGYFIVSSSPLLLPVKTNTKSSAETLYVNYAPSLQNTKLGLLLTSNFITTEEDPTLYDPSAGFYNFAAPGADRLEISPSLIQITPNSDEEVIELVEIINGVSRAVEPGLIDDTKSLSSKDCDGDKILKPFIIDIIGTTLNINSGRAIVNCTDIEIVENQSVSLLKTSDNKRLFNQVFNDQCLSDAVIVQSNFDTPLLSGVSGNDFSSVNTNYFGSGKIRKLFSDEAVRLEIVNCDGIKIGCLTLLDIEKNDESSYKLYFNELQSYVSTIATSALFTEACILSLDGEKVFTIESSVVSTCAETTPGGNKRLVYKVPRGTNIKSVFDADYMITRDFVADITTSSIPGENAGSPISATIAEFNIDIPNGVFNDNNTTPNLDLFTVLINGKVVPIKTGNTKTPHIRINSSKSKVTVVLSSAEYSPKAEDGTTSITVPSAGKCYLITKVRFPEKSSAVPSGSVSSTPIPHRKKRLREARGAFIQNLSTERRISLGYSDVYLLKSITNAAGDDITNQFLFDDGQRNDRYDHASVTLLPGITADDANKEFVITFRYFEHEPIAPGFYGPITVNSYGFDSNGEAISGFHGTDINGNQMTFGYDEIPNFLDRITGEVIPAADAIDFRMIRTEEGLIENGVNKSSILRARWFPSPDSSSGLESSYKLDLPRVDLLVLKEDGTFVLVEGEPASTPIAPEYPKDGCVVAEINVPGVVLSSEDFIVKKPPIKSISLPELNDMQNRIAELEKSLSIQILENKAKTQSVSMRNEFLTGMVVDDFGGHYVGDVSNDEYNCSMDFSKGTLRLPFTTKFFDFIPDSGYPTSATAENGYFITAEELTGVTLLSNDQATSNISVNSFGSNDWHGYLSVDRPFHLWVDQTTKPIVRNNSRGQNDAWESGGESVQPFGRKNGFGTQWGFWRSLWFGDSFILNTTFEKDRASSKGFSDSITNNAPTRFVRNVNRDALFAPNKKTIGNGGFGLTDSKTSRYVDSSLSFFSPENYLIVRGGSLKPNTTFSVYFENMTTPVSSSRIMNLDGVSLSSVESNNYGNIEFLLYIPNGSYITGNKVVKIVENTQTTKPSYASCLYSNSGASWKNVAETDDTSVEFELCPTGRTDVLIRNDKTTYTNSSVSNGVYQKFFIDKGEYPNGLVLDNIAVYLSQIDTNIPISLEIRRVVNGKIDSNNIVRNSRIEIQPTSIGYSKFFFTKPTYLSFGEYAILLKTNSTIYKADISQRGIVRTDSTASASQSDLYATGIFGTNGFFGGSSLSQTEDKNTSLRFYIIRKSYKVNSTNTKTIKTRLPFLSGTNSTFEYDLLSLSNDNWRTTIGDVVYTLVNDGIETSISSNTDIWGSDIYKTLSSRIKVGVSTSNEKISPIIDIRKMGILLVKNHISKTTDILQNGVETQNFGGSNGSLMKYVTRRTDLKFGANVLRGSIEAITPKDVDIRMYAKVLYEGDLDFDSQEYTEMRRIFGSDSISKDNFQEMIFELDLSSSTKNFISFCTKIIITSNSTDTSTNRIDFYPEIRNLSVVSSAR